ncbi:hypothetical protein [Ochrobactrum soli]|nr:hypothetical protein [[Ochrobactrum] soli]
MAALTSDNGIIARLVGHIKTLREQNQMLSEIITRSGNSAADMGERFPANGLAESGMDGAAMTEQNVASPTRLMVVTPTKKKEAEPQPAPAKETKAEPSDKPVTKDGA